MIFDQDFPPTPLIELPRLAHRANVSQVFVKDESKRPLGNFKVLGGMVAGLRALERRGSSPFRLICASDGNHGLAVAAAANMAGASARIFLPVAASPQRAARIEAQGGEIVWIEGTYDDAVDRAEAAAALGEGILVPDTTRQSSDPIVDEVMSGYGRICSELVGQLPCAPTHLFLQAGVGGLAAAMAEGFHEQMSPPAKLIVVEPASAGCVSAGIAAGKPVQIDGDLHSCAEMLSCGLASSPALQVLLRHDVCSMLVGEADLFDAVEILRNSDGPATTPSGAAGVAGLISAACSTNLRLAFGLSPESRVLVIATEGELDSTPLPAAR